MLSNFCIAHLHVRQVLGYLCMLCFKHFKFIHLIHNLITQITFMLLTKLM